MAEEKTSPAKKKLRLTITTPRGVKFEEPCDMVVMRLIDGEMGILPGHAPISTVLGDGILRIINEGYEAKLAVFGGLVEVDKNEVNIFTTIAQLPGEIDEARAEEDRQRAVAAMSQEEPDVQFQFAQAMLHRASVRLEVSQFEDETDDDLDVDIQLGNEPRENQADEAKDEE